MNIAIIGAGNVGTSLAKAFTAVGHTVQFGVRYPESPKIQNLIEEIGVDVSASTVGDAIGGAEIVVFATPPGAIESVIAAGGDWSGKIIIDATNRFSNITEVSNAEEIAQQAVGASVVKAFNTIGANRYGAPVFGEQRASMFICGDDEPAKRTVGEIVTAMGFDLVDAGDLKQAILLEGLARLWVSLARGEYGREIGFSLLKS